MNQISSTGKPMFGNPTDGLDFAAVIETKRDGHTFKTQAERLAELSIVCRDAAALEHCRQQAGQPSAARAPWPASTIEFFRQHARKFHE